MPDLLASVRTRRSRCKRVSFLTIPPDPVTGCRIWPGKPDHVGYGRWSRGKHQGYAHRAAWIEVNGPIPKGMCVLHRCDTMRCCEVLHLFLGTRADNNADRDKKNRQARGERASRRLNARERLAILERYNAGGVTQLQLAQQFNISRIAINQLVTGRSWRHVQ